MNYAILQVRLGHYFKLWQVMVDKDDSVSFESKKTTPKPKNNNKKYVKWRKIPQNNSFLPPGLLIQKSSIDSLISKVLGWEVAVQKCAIQWFSFGEKHDFISGFLFM